MKADELSHSAAAMSSLVLRLIAEGLVSLGRAVQVDPIKPALKAPGTKRLKMIYNGPVSNFAFNFDLRRYISGTRCT